MSLPLFRQCRKSGDPDNHCAELNQPGYPVAQHKLHKVPEISNVQQLRVNCLRFGEDTSDPSELPKSLLTQSSALCQLDIPATA